MAQTYDRRINLYINGREIKNDLASIQKEMYKATNELRRMTIGSDEFNKKAAEVRQLKQHFSAAQASLRETASPLKNLIGFAKGLLPAFGFGAIAAGAKFAFDQVVASTDTLSTKWAVFMGGMKGATDEFWRTIATGDWSNFLNNMGEAIRVGREYEATLDEIEAKQRALGIAEADARAEIVATEEALRNKNLSEVERIAAGKRRIAIEEELAIKRAKVGAEEYNNESLLAQQASRLSKDKLMELMADFDSEKKIRAERYNALKDELRLLEAAQAKSGAATGVLYPGMTSTTSSANPRIAEIKQQMQGFDTDVVDYAASLSLLGNVTDEQLNKVVAAYRAMQDAEESGRESIKRVITQVNSLQSGEGTKGESSAAKAAKTIDSLTDKARQALIPEEDAPIKDFWTADIERQAEALATKKAAEEEWTSWLKNQIDERVDNLAEGFEKEKELEQARADLKLTVIDAAGQIAGALASMAKEGSAAQIALIAVEKAAAIAQIIFNTAVANAKAVAMSPLTFGQPWVTINTATAIGSIAGIVGTTISSFKDRKNNNVKGYASGGFTKGESMYIAGEAGTEWIAPNWMTKRLAPTFAALEQVRLNPAALQTFASGGFAGTPGAVSPPLLPGGVAAGRGGIDAATAQNLTAAINNLLLWQPSVAVETFERKKQQYNKIQNTRGL